MNGIEKDRVMESIRSETEKMLGNEFEVSIVFHQRNNDVWTNTLQIIKKEYPKVIFYLNDMVQQYESGLSMESIVRNIKEEIEQSRLLTRSDAENILELMGDYEKIRSMVNCKLINTKANRTLLQDIPNIPFLDMSVVFYILLPESNRIEGGSYTELIGNHHIKEWNVDINMLYEDSIKNMEIPAVKNLAEEIMPLFTGHEMLVLSNGDSCLGAAGILYPGALEKVAAKYRSSLLIIPSSIHEMILLKDDGLFRYEEVQKIIQSVNSDVVEPSDILSNSLYRYDREKKTISLALKGEEI